VLGATFAAGGEQPVPYLVESVDGKHVARPKARRVVAKHVAEQVAEMMVGTCQSGSAAKSFRNKNKVTVAGKTGTLSTRDPFYMEHSWFVGFAPAEAPEVVVSVLLGNPESWWLRGHEAAKRMIDRSIERSIGRAVGRASQRAEDRDGKPDRATAAAK
jgi:penicillin-binding protein A